RRALREPEEADLAGLDQPGHGTDRLLDRRLGIDAVLIVEGDHVGTEARQAGVARLPDVARAPVHPIAAAVVRAHRAELGGEHDRAPVRSERSTEEFLVVAGAV